MHARSALFTLFGDIVRPAGGEAWLTALTGAMGALGFTPQATRTALSRMTAEGWVAPRRAGRYAAYGLTPRGVDRLEEAAARIYRLSAAPWDGQWRLLLPPPAVDADAELARTLSWMGFGPLCPGVWVSPSDHGTRLNALPGLADADHLVARRDLLGPGAPGGLAAQDRRVAERAWDLGALRAAHAQFLERWGKPGEGGSPSDADPRAAFVDRILLVHHWRSFLFLDPGLPAELLPGDWLGTDAAARFAERHEALAAASWAWWDQLTAPTPAALLVARTPDPIREKP